MANTNPDRYSTDLNRAVEMLRAALGTRAEISASGKPEAEANVARVVLHLPDGQRIELTLEALPASRQANAPHGSVLVLNRALPEMLERLRRGRLSFVDVGRGVVSLELPSLLIDRTGLKLPRRAAASRPLRNPFADRASLVSRTLVEHPGRVWQLRELASDAEVSTMTASHVVRQLDQMRAVEVEREGRSILIRLRSVRTLVELWAMHYEWTKNARVALHAPMGDPQRFLPRLKSSLGKRRWALTMQAGASLVAPHAVWDKVHLYVDVDKPTDLAHIFDATEYVPSPTGRLVVMQPWYRDSVWHGLQAVKRLPLVSNLQLALDLWHYQVRGREQAEHLLRTELSASTAP